MEQIIISVTFAIVALVASLLLFDAANKVGPSKRSKAYRIVAGAILALMAACEYLIFGGIPAENNKEVVLTVKEESLTNAEPEKPLDIEESLAENGRIATLKKTKEWQNFSAFWRKLDSLEIDYGYPKYEIEKYELSAERIKVIYDLHNIPSSLISYEEISLLDRITEMRIENRRNDAMATSRMAAPININFVSSNKDSIIYNLEYKIDTLDNLRQQGAIDNDEFNQALETIKEDIKIAILLDEILDTYPEYNGNIENKNYPTNMQTVEKYIAEIEKNYKNYPPQTQAAQQTGQLSPAQEIENNYELKYQQYKHDSFKERLKQINDDYPVFGELIDGLERYENE